jgi:hypothetical protein
LEIPFINFQRGIGGSILIIPVKWGASKIIIVKDDVDFFAKSGADFS